MKQMVLVTPVTWSTLSSFLHPSLSSYEGFQNNPRARLKESPGQGLDPEMQKRKGSSGPSASLGEERGWRWGRGSCGTGERQTQKTYRAHHSAGGDSLSEDNRLRAELRSHELRGRDKGGTEDKTQPLAL